MDNYHIGAIMAHQMLLFTAVTVAIMNIFLTIRHTRSDEEQGRIEVIRSLPVGRLSSAAATMLVLFLTNLSLGVLTALGLGILGLEGMDWPIHSHSQHRAHLFRLCDPPPGPTD